MQQWMQGYLSTKEPTMEEIEDALKDFGFHHRAIDVQRLYAMRDTHLGYEGGVLAQPDEYWQDLATMYWLRKWCEMDKKIIRLEQTSWIDNVRSGSGLSGKVKANGND